MKTTNIAEAATKIVELLAPFESEERQRAVRAALTLLGEGALPTVEPATGRLNDDVDGTPARAKAWLRQHGVTSENLEHVFHRDGDRVEVIAAGIPGSSTKERTLNAYLLAGISRLLATGDASFDDGTARQLCRTLGHYDHTNHATYLRDKGNKFAGSKEQGWTLTAPGLAQAAALIKQMTSAG
jgi:hypothetical protein